METQGARPKGSEYMWWAKTSSAARFNLAVSGVPNIGLADLGLSHVDVEINGPGGYGYAPLLEAVAAKEGVSPENVVLAAGTSMANHLAMAALLEPGDGVLMEHPVYDPILSTARYLGAEVRFFHRRPEEAWRVNPDEVARLMTPKTRLVVLTSLHNPTAALADEPTLAAVGEAARRNGARVLVDEVYLDAAFERAPRTAARLGPEFVTTNSLTKVYGASGVRCGWVLADPETARRMWRLNDLFGVVAPYASELVSLAVFGRLEALRERARALLDTNRRVLHAFYDARGDLDAVRYEWGTTSFPRLARGGVDRLCAVLRGEYEASVVPGAFFGRGDHFRVGLTADPETFAAGIERLGAALDGLG